MPPSTSEIISFGPFALSRSRRQLTKNGAPVRLGGRAFDLLSILVEQAGSVVSQKELLERVWPGIYVEDVSLRVRIADLRRVLEQDEEERRYLANIPGRGYSFIGEISRSTVETRAEAADPRYNLPKLHPLVVGRDETTDEVCRALKARRFLSLVGPGGIGKTTVALSAAWALLDEFKGEVCFVELSPLGQPSLLTATVASSFGLPVHTGDPIPALVDRLSGRPVLLVLDGAEHLILDAAVLAERLFVDSRDLHILVTSREALRVQGESVFLVPGLESPPDVGGLTLAEVGGFSAARLFLDRCVMAGLQRDFTDADAPTIVAICRKLGGLPLALEFAAGRAGAHGLTETGALLNTEFALRWPGRRTAPPRHQTLRAMLDWSFNLLSETERIVLRRLSVFAGRCTPAAVRHIAAHTDLWEQDVLDALNGLVAKSLVSVDASGEADRFRLLDTTRSYATTKLAKAGELDALRRRQATYYRDVLKGVGGGSRKDRDPIDIDDIRAALRWSFGKRGDEVLGAELVAHSASIWFSRALLSECHAWMSKAAEVYERHDAAARELMVILGVRGSAEMQMHGFSAESTLTWMKTLELAESLHDSLGQFSAYMSLWVGDLREAWYSKALATAERCLRASDKISHPAFRPAAEWMVGHTLHQLGRLQESQEHLNASLSCDTEEARLSFVRSTGLDRRTNLLATMANTLWMMGFAEQAQPCGESAIASARALQFELAVGEAMIWTGFNRYLSDPEIGAIEQDMVELLEHGRSRAVDSEVGFALSILGLCQARRGDFEAGRKSVSEGLGLFAKAHLESFSPIVLAHLCETTIGLGRDREAAGLMADLRARDRNPEHFCTPEILRVRALLLIAQGNQRGGEELFRDALAMARRQGALAWELKTASSAAKFLIGRGRHAEALAMLEPVYDRFTEGFETADLRTARETLSRLDRRRLPPVRS